MDFVERDADMIKVSVDGVEINVNIEVKRIQFSSLIHIQLHTDLEVGAEVTMMVQVKRSTTY